MDAALKQQTQPQAEPQAAAPQAADENTTVDRKVQDLAIVAAKLVEVLKRENDALRENAVTDYNMLVDEKTALTRIFETRTAALAGTKADLAALDPALRGKMRELTQGVSALIEENGRRLRAAIEANTRVVEMVRTAVKDSTPGPSVYSASGRKGAAKSAGNEARDMSLSYNSVL